jgi:hypothetical protein
MSVRANVIKAGGSQKGHELKKGVFDEVLVSAGEVIQELKPEIAKCKLQSVSARHHQTIPHW